MLLLVEDPLPLYIIGGFFSVPLLIKALISLESIIKKYSISRREYNKSRGTAHKKLLQNQLKKIKTMIKNEENLLKKHRDKKSNTEKEKIKEIDYAATTYIFNKDFTNIPGIGRILKERIQRSVFNGTLDSLYRCNRVQGIGEQKYWEIRRWIEYTKRTMYRVIESNFPGKQGIVARYNKQLIEIGKNIQEVEERLSRLRDYSSQAEKDLKKLSRVTSGTFNKSYGGDEEASKLVTEYHLGLFPEWQRMPTWFKEMMEATV